MAIVEIDEIEESDEGLVTIHVNVIDPSSDITEETISIEFERAWYEQWYDMWISKGRPTYVSCMKTANGYDLGIVDNSFLADRVLKGVQ